MHKTTIDDELPLLGNCNAILVSDKISEEQQQQKK